MPRTEPPDAGDDLRNLAERHASDPMLRGGLQARPGFTGKLMLAVVALLALFAVVVGLASVAYLSRRQAPDRRELVFPLLSKTPPGPATSPARRR